MSDDMGTAGEAGVTMLLIVLNRTLGLPVLLETRLENRQPSFL